MFPLGRLAAASQQVAETRDRTACPQTLGVTIAHRPFTVRHNQFTQLDAPHWAVLLVLYRAFRTAGRGRDAARRDVVADAEIMAWAVEASRKKAR